jgi:hypothetical protein
VVSLAIACDTIPEHFALSATIPEQVTPRSLSGHNLIAFSSGTSWILRGPTLSFHRDVCTNYKTRDAEKYCLPCRAPLTIIAAKAATESGHFSSLDTQLPIDRSENTEWSATRTPWPITGL